MCDLRIHLSWVIGMKTFDWEERKVGKTILELYQKTNQFHFMNHMVKMRKKK